jgi:hypothetical protein
VIPVRGGRSAVAHERDDLGALAAAALDLDPASHEARELASAAAAAGAGLVPSTARARRIAGFDPHPPAPSLTMKMKTTFIF